jgi:hypothetical protein
MLHPQANTNVEEAEMGVWASSTKFEGDPRELAASLTRVEAIERWSPIPFKLGSHLDTLRTGEQVDVEGSLLGRGVRFSVDIRRADDHGLSLLARGPFEIGVDYAIEPASSTVSARVVTKGGGPRAKLLASAANAMLAAGALDHALRRIVGQSELAGAPI